MNRIEQAYNGDPEYEWSRLERHRVEYGVTLRALEDHLPPAPVKIADVGGSVGRYSIELSRRGYNVTLVDIAQSCLNFAQTRVGEAGVQLAGVVKADARDLSVFEDESFEAVLLMGPLYHLLEHEERLQAVREARRVLKPGGNIFAAFISPFCILQYSAAQYVEYIHDRRDELEGILTTGVYRQTESSGRFPDAWFAHPDKIPPLMTEGGFERLDLLACEAIACYMEENINQASEELHREWIDLIYRLSREPSIMGAGGHILYVGRKAE